MCLHLHLSPPFTSSCSRMQILSSLLFLFAQVLSAPECAFAFVVFVCRAVRSALLFNSVAGLRIESSAFTSFLLSPLLIPHVNHAHYFSRSNFLTMIVIMKVALSLFLSLAACVCGVCSGHDAWLHLLSTLLSAAAAHLLHSHLHMPRPLTSSFFLSLSLFSSLLPPFSISESETGNEVD